jgi:2-polyprenyl-3-methyl-5-hydroxy-6-metoxy-1,4-benzoquinol methylase
MIKQLEKLDVRIPKWDMGNLTERDCPFCSSENEPMLIRPDQLPVAFCNSCECWYVAKLPSVSEIKKLYDGYYSTHRPSDLSKKIASQMIKNAKDSSKSQWQVQTLSGILGGLRGKRILEVGCGLCGFLLSAKAEGAEVIGCDLSPESCEFAQKKLGICVYCSTLECCLSSIGKVDAVIMRDLIEHPIEPLAVISAAHEVLKPGGVLLLHTPNGGEAGTHIETAKKWVGFRVDLEHLQYLSPRTINWLSHKVGLSIERLVAFGFPGLKGINVLPSRGKTNVGRVKDMVKRIPCMHTMVNALRAVKAELNGGYQDPRLGSYHLFAVLRKE